MGTPREDNARILELQKQIRIVTSRLFDEDPTVESPVVPVDDVANYINSVVNWKRFYRLVDAIGEDLNARQDRFEKGTLLEMAMELYSNAKLKYIGQEGRLGDLELMVNGKLIRIEQKYSANIIFTPKGKLQRGFKKQSIVNFQGSNKPDTIPENFPDYLLLVGERGCGLISKYDLAKNGFHKADDALHAQYDPSELVILHGPVLKNKSNNEDRIGYKALKRQLQTQYILSVK